MSAQTVSQLARALDATGLVVNAVTTDQWTAATPCTDWTAADLLRHLASDEIGFIEQSPDGLIMLAKKGEETVQSRSFFAVFESGEEWRLTVEGKTLGSLPISFPVHKDSLVVFAGRRWIVLDLDEKTNTLFVAPHPGGVVPRFERADGERLHDRLAAEMRAVYLASDEPAYLDDKAKELLAEGRETFRELDLETTRLVEEENDLHIFLWRGSAMTAVFGAATAMVGLPAHVHDLGLTLTKTNAREAIEKLKRFAEGGSVRAAEISAFVENVAAGKFRDQVPESLARGLWAAQHEIETSEIPEIAKELSLSPG